MAAAEQRWRGRFEIDAGVGIFLGDTRIRLLEAIEARGSISQAAKDVPISYKAAWDAIDAMNNLAEHPLVDRSTGGRRGGGSQLTDYGRQMVALYRALEAETQTALERLAPALDDGGATVARFRQLLRLMSLRTSARNQLIGRICGLKDGDVDFEVRLRLDPDHEVVAVITRESAENLELAIGKEVMALVKSSSVLLLTDPALKISARNRLWGEVIKLRESPVNSEVTLRLPGGKTVCAVVTHDSVGNLGLAPGVRACAVFKASAVILCATD